MEISRRSFLWLPALTPLLQWKSPGSWLNASLHRFAYDHVLGTSMDIEVWSSRSTAEQAHDAVLSEIERLTSILNTRDPNSEIRKLDDAIHPSQESGLSPELCEIFSIYRHWNSRTNGALSIRPNGPTSPINIDALGKAFIIDRAAAAAMAAAPDIRGLLLNIGGDIVIKGQACDIGLANPRASQDNAEPLTWIRLQNAAVASSGFYARGAHLVDARTGLPSIKAAGSSVIAHDAVTANALATTLCVTDDSEGLRIVERTSGAEGIRMDRDGTVQKSSGFHSFEKPRLIRTAVALPSPWPAGFELNVSLTLTSGESFSGRGFGRGGRGKSERQYVAIWIEDSGGKLIRVLAFMANREQYYKELSTFFNVAVRNQVRLSTIARATRAPGNYQFVWDGMDEKKMPVPSGSYRVVIETNQEHGQYGKQAGVIECGDKPAEITLPATTNFEPVRIQFGPRH